MISLFLYAKGTEKGRDCYTKNCHRKESSYGFQPIPSFSDTISHPAAAGIETDWKIGLPEPLRISGLDLASLFGNLLENAIDGCCSLPEGSRYSCLTAELRHGRMLYVVSTNSFYGQVQKGTDGYRSTQHSGKGTGLASIAAVAEKYHGSVRVSHSGEEFFVDVALKV